MYTHNSARDPRKSRKSRANATTKEGEINALTTKASVMKFDINI